MKSTAQLTSLPDPAPEDTEDPEDVGSVGEFDEATPITRRATGRTRTGRAAGTAGTADTDTAPPLLRAALHYAEDLRWEVAPGHHLVQQEFRAVCSCGHPACPRPGAHPLSDAWLVEATTNPLRVRQLWVQHPSASIMLPAGRGFDVIDVPETAGLLAMARLERQSVALGPVVSGPGRRFHFFVLPGVREKLPVLIRQLGWRPERLDLRCRGEGEYVLVPPSNAGLPEASAQWNREPSGDGQWLPDASSLLPALAYACGL